MPLVGYRELPGSVDELAARGGTKPVIWSELAGGWPDHLAFLMNRKQTLDGTEGLAIVLKGVTLNPR